MDYSPILNIDPYTQYQSINLDWLLAKVGENAEEIKEVSEAAKAAQSTANDAAADAKNAQNKATEAKLESNRAKNKADEALRTANNAYDTINFIEPVVDAVFYDQLTFESMQELDVVAFQKPVIFLYADESLFVTTKVSSYVGDLDTGNMQEYRFSQTFFTNAGVLKILQAALSANGWSVNFKEITT